jgi:SAM-dependent methyltransferase
MIDDLKEKDVKKGHGGYPILFENTYIRKMLRLAKAGKNDIFCDLGCGLAQNLIIAASEFNVRKAVGFERNERRSRKAVKRIKLKDLGTQCELIDESFDRVLDGRSKSFALENATIVFYGLATDRELLKSLKERLQDGCRLVYYNTCLFPEIMPNKVDIPFYVSTVPFKKTRSELAWLRKVVGKKRSLIQRGRRPDANELWDELRHDYRHFSDITRIRDYRQRLRQHLSS